MELRLERMRKFRALVGEARETLPLKDRRVRGRLAEIHDAYRRMLEVIAAALEEWKRHVAAVGSK